jgi:hypothetical protein
MEITRNIVDVSKFNHEAEPPYELRWQDFQMAMQDVYDFFFDVNSHLLDKGLQRLDDMLRPATMSGLLSDTLSASLGRVNTIERVDDECEIHKESVYHIQFIEPCEDPSEAFETPEQPLNLVALLISLPVILPGVNTIAFRRHDRRQAQVTDRLPRLIAFTGLIHNHVFG